MSWDAVAALGVVAAAVAVLGWRSRASKPTCSRCAVVTPSPRPTGGSVRKASGELRIGR